MTLDEALTETVSGARMTAAHLQPGCYIEHSFSRGFIRCWPVDKPEYEPNRTQCDFRASAFDEAATDWHEVVRPEPVAAPPAPKPAIVAGWGKPVPKPVESVPEPKSVMTLKDGVWTKEPLTAAPPADSKWGSPKKEPGKWGT